MLKIKTWTGFLATMFVALTGFVGFASIDAAADSSQKSVMPQGSYQEAQNWNDTVCCRRGRSDWRTTWRECSRAGGYEVSSRACRNDVWDNRWDRSWWHWPGNLNARVCCKRGRQDWYTSARECRNSYGVQAHNRECRDDRWDNRWDDRWDGRWRDSRGDWNRRVCCKRGRSDWFTTARECRNAYGYETSRRECRND